MSGDYHMLNELSRYVWTTDGMRPAFPYPYLPAYVLSSDFEATNRQHDIELRRMATIAAAESVENDALREALTDLVNRLEKMASVVDALDAAYLRFLVDDAREALRATRDPPTSPPTPGTSTPPQP